MSVRCHQVNDLGRFPNELFDLVRLCHLVRTVCRSWPSPPARRGTYRDGYRELHAMPAAKEVSADVALGYAHHAYAAAGRDRPKHPPTLPDSVTVASAFDVRGTSGS